MKRILNPLALVFVAVTAFAKPIAPRLLKNEEWKNGLLYSGVSLGDFSESERVASFLIFEMSWQKKKASGIVEDLSYRYSPARKVLSVILDFNQLSSEFKNLAPADIAKNIESKEELSWIKSQANPPPEKFKALLVESLAQSFSRDLPGFAWKESRQAQKDLSKAEFKFRYETLTVHKFLRAKGGSLGGIIEFEIFENSKGNILGSRVNEEIAID